jgi:hypothetical protein
VNLGNVPAQGVIGLETLRLGLRADTLGAFEGTPFEGPPFDSSALDGHAFDGREQGK